MLRTVESALVSETRTLRAIYLPPFCQVPPPEGDSRAIVLENDDEPLVHVDYAVRPRVAAWDRLVLVVQPPPGHGIREGEWVDPHLYRIARTLRAGYRRNLFPPQAYLDSIADAVAEHLTQNYMHARRQRERAGLSESRLKKALAYIEAHLFEPLPVDAIADAAHLSSFHFRRMFKRSTGLGPHEFVMRRRVEHAKTLLAESETPIAEIARRVGFCSQAHFTTVFRRHTDFTPWRYRASHRSGKQ